MILAIECVAACIVFGMAIVGSTLANKEAWIHEYAPEVRERFIERNPNFKAKEKTKQTVGLIIAKLLVCLLFTAALSAMAYFAGARNFLIGAIYSYVIWTVVNIFDTVILDIGVFAHWKKVRLPGTEDMDKEYASNWKKGIKDGFFGVLIGIPVACLCGLVIHFVL